MGTMKIIYIFVAPQTPATYYVRAEYVQGTAILKPNYPEVGMIKNKATAQYRIKLVSTEKTQAEVFKIKIHTTIKHGEIDLYSRECSDMKTCKIPYLAITDPEFAA